MSESKKEIYTYEAPWPIYGMAWSMRDEARYSFRCGVLCSVRRGRLRCQWSVVQDGVCWHDMHSAMFLRCSASADLLASCVDDAGRMAWCDRFALGSFIEEYCNVVRIVGLDDKGNFNVMAQLDHPYPTTNIMWKPSKSTAGKDLLATTGDYLRIWSVSDSGKEVRNEALLNNVSSARLVRHHSGHPECDLFARVAGVERLHHQNKTSEYCAPLTSFDWNTADPNIIGTSSIDTTCTIWDINVRDSVHLRACWPRVHAAVHNMLTRVDTSHHRQANQRRSSLRTTRLCTTSRLSPIVRPSLRLSAPTARFGSLISGECTVGQGSLC